MTIKQTLESLEKLGLISRKPKPMYVYLLFFAYLLIWIVALVYYLKFQYEILRIWIIIVGILTGITLVHAIIHGYIIKILETGNKNSKKEK